MATNDLLMRGIKLFAAAAIQKCRDNEADHLAIRDELTWAEHMRASHEARAISASEFTHYGWFMFCPIYIRSDGNNSVDLVATRNWIPEWVQDVAILWFRFCEMTMQTINPDYSNGIPIIFTGQISKGSDRA